MQRNGPHGWGQTDAPVGLAKRYAGPSMKRYLKFALAGLAMFVVALVAAFTSMRLAIHGREVDVPKLEGLSDDAAAAAVRSLGLNLSVENRFYSAGVQANHVLSQSPAPGTLVRRGGQVRVTESLGGQQTQIPEVIGQTERPATLVLKRLQLELGASAHLPAPGQPGIVLAQSPPPNSGAYFGPRVSVLVADAENAAPVQAYIMPSLIGLTVSAASQKLSTVGLHITSATDPTFVAPETVTVPDPNADPAIPPTVAPSVPPPVSAAGVISWQTPAAGHRVTRGDAIRLSAHEPTLDLPSLPQSPVAPSLPPVQ